MIPFFEHRSIIHLVVSRLGVDAPIGQMSRFRMDPGLLTQIGHQKDIGRVGVPLTKIYSSKKRYLVRLPLLISGSRIVATLRYTIAGCRVRLWTDTQNARPT